MRAVVFLCAVLVLAGQLAAEKPAPRAESPVIAGCPVFPADNIWNAPIDTLPVDRNSAAYIATVGPDRVLHPDFGSGTFDGGLVGVPFIDVPGSQAKVRVTFQYGDESDPGPYPVPPNAPIEGGSGSTGDRHVLVVDRDNCLLYELFAAYPQADGTWRAGSGAIFNLRSNTLRPAGWTSADAAGLPVLPGLARYEEVAAGEVRHALRLTVPRTQKKYVWPGRHYASSLTGAEYPPMGQRFRLKAGYDISGFSPEVQVILRALKKYGLILADNGQSWFITGAPDERWNNERLRELRRVKGSDLEAVDVSPLMMNPDSGQARSRPSNGVTNGASFVGGSVAPGEIIALFGSGLGPATGAGARFNSSALLETSLEGTRVLFDGVAAPLLYAQANQVNAILPYAVAAKSVTEVQVEYSGTRSMSVFLQVGPAAPGIFTWDSSGAGRGVVLHPDWSLNSASNPAPRGSVVVMYATGEGQTDPPGVDGKRAGDAPPKPRLPVAVSIGGQPASVLYAGGAPGFVAGLMQVNARIPDTAPAGDAVPVVLTVGTAASQPGVTLAVR